MPIMALEVLLTIHVSGIRLYAYPGGVHLILKQLAILETLIDYSEYFPRLQVDGYINSFLRWLLSIQIENGSFPGGLGTSGSPSFSIVDKFFLACFAPMNLRTSLISLTL